MKNHPIEVYQDNQKLSRTGNSRTVYSDPVEVIVGEFYNKPSASKVRETYIEKVRETHHHHYYKPEKEKRSPEPISNADFVTFLLLPLGVVFLCGLLIGGLLGGT